MEPFRASFCGGGGDRGLLEAACGSPWEGFGVDTRSAKRLVIDYEHAGIVT
jgi:hypothetical protein